MPIRWQFATEDEFLKALRDWFAGQALVATTLIATKEAITTELPAKAAYALADIMLKERGNKK